MSRAAADRSEAVAGYEAAAAALIARYDTISAAELHAPHLRHLPAGPGRLLDVGAGTGRDAAFFAARGWTALAVEPAAAFRRAGAARHVDGPVAWEDDLLPGLPRVLARAETFDLVLVVGVWQHLAPRDRGPAMETLARLLAPDGALLLALRHGPAPADRATFPIDPAETIACAEAAGLRATYRDERPALQADARAAGVRWTWLVLGTAARPAPRRLTRRSPP
ncbi:methyltransferase domain-containing protein [Salinarimonas sp.]|uniref:class I SAM-dependent methyltransferase n=1 Tax=Salinarimonas sp. TaxID=2766526 RepID=UPI0032D8DB3A